jgi:hypothetical protein
MQSKVVVMNDNVGIWKEAVCAVLSLPEHKMTLSSYIQSIHRYRSSSDLRPLNLVITGRTQPKFEMDTSQIKAQNITTTEIRMFQVF